jgi:lipopolysaccharide export system permease protein
MTTFDLRNPDFFNTDLPKSRENRFNGHNFAKIGIITNQGTNALLQTMTINSNVNRYIFREMLPPLGLNLLFFTFIFLISDMLEITNWIVNYSIGISTVLWMIIYSMPDFLIFVVPMSVMLAILLTFLRMSGDNEIIALTSGGLSFYGLLPPVLLICLMGSLLTGFMTIYALPWGRSSMEELTQKIAASNPDIGLKEKTFNDDFGDMIFYVNKVDQKNNLLIGVFIEDRRQPDMDVTVIATKGRLFDDPEKRVHHLRLLDGTIHRTNLQDGSVSSIHFNTYTSTFGPKDMVPDKKKKRKHQKAMSLGELRQFTKAAPTKDEAYYKALLELHRKFSMPFACFALGLIALPLGVQSKSANRTFGLIVGLFLFLFYNLLLSAGKILGESGALPPVFGMWLPNVVTGAVAWYLMIQTAKERTTRLDVLARKFQRLPAWFKGL